MATGYPDDIGSRVTTPPKRGDVPQDDLGERVTFPPKSDMPGKKPGRFANGDDILGRYEVLSELGQGGMGVVYKCFDKTGGVEVAVKGLPPEVSHDATSMEDIRDNFQLVSDLRHPGIVGIRNLEADPKTGDYYLVMDLAAGKNLHRWAKTHQGPEFFDVKLKIVAEIAAALDYAHSRRIMHRDIKPENVMIDADDHVHVLDFGLASQIHSSMSRVSLVVRSQSGTPSYKAPEQWRGQPQNAATDQYALGVLAYELMAGYLPFDSDDIAILRMSVLSEPVSEIQDVPSYVNEALAKAMSKSPAQRFKTCEDFANALAGKVAPAEPVKTQRKTPVASAGEMPVSGKGGKGKGGVVAGIAAMACVAAIAVFVLTRPGDPTDEPSPPRPGEITTPPVANPIELALEAFRGNDFQTGYKYAMSTDRTHPKLQCYIGMCYDQQEPLSKGMRIAKDDWTAKTWYEKAAEQGDARAMTYLGLFYENGRGCNGKDYKSAENWFEKAAAKDYPEGKANLRRLRDKVAAEKAKEDENRRKNEARQRLEDLRRRGYVIESDWKGNEKAVWKEGNTLPQYPHWVTSAKENTWRVEDGYARIDPNGAVWSPVAWKPGWQKLPDVKAGDHEGEWLHRSQCSTCRGQKSVSKASACSTCGGSGRVTNSNYCQSCQGTGHQSQVYGCTVCNGSGHSNSRCGQCGGSRTVMCAGCSGSGRVVNPGAVVGGIVNIFGAASGRRGRVPTGPASIPCSSCGGSGRSRCGMCGGRGVVNSSCHNCSGSGQVTQTIACTTCQGSGRTKSVGTCPHCSNGKVYKSQSCTECNGAGVVWR